jgi:ribosomal protein S18 acetylase RimI-like enzyme
MSTQLKIYKLALSNIRQKPQQLCLENFKKIKKISDDRINNIPNGYITINFYDKKKWYNYAGYITYMVKTGEIGLFELVPEYRNRGLGKQIIYDVAKHMKKHNTSHIWIETVGEDPFYSHIFNTKFNKI